jgi:uncharacterized protein YjbI with pentapeptide repeats
MSEQEPVQTATATQPKAVPEGYMTWKEYWTKAHNQPWRREPEIEEERQAYLTERRAIQPDIAKGVYPLKDIKLNRADVEWLLATHESGGIVGPVEWSDLHQRHRQGLDLRGAHFEPLENLSWLPLARLRGAFDHNLAEFPYPWYVPSEEAREAAAVDLDGVILELTHVEGASLDGAYLRGAMIAGSEFRESSLNRVHLEGAILDRTGLEMCNLVEAQFTRAYLDKVHFERAILSDANLAGASVLRTFFDAGTVLDGLRLRDDQNGEVSFLDMRWNEANLAVTDWSRMTRGFLGLRRRFEAIVLGNERVARKSKKPF